MKVRVFLRRPEVPGFWPSNGVVATVVMWSDIGELEGVAPMQWEEESGEGGGNL